MPTTQTVWLTRQMTTMRHIRGLFEGLTQQEVLDYGEVRIMVIDQDHAVTVPKAAFASVVDPETDLSGDVVLTIDNLPPQGILYIANED